MRPRPRVASARIHADRDIGDQPDAHALPARILLNCRETARREPLQEHVELDFAGLGRCETGRRWRARRTPLGRPVAPTPLRFWLGKPVPMQRLEQRVLAQAFAAFPHEREEIGCETIAPVELVRREVIPQAPQQRVLASGCLWPVDQSVGLRLRGRVARERRDTLLSEHDCGIGVERIEEQPV